MTLFGPGEEAEGAWRDLDMAREPKLSHSRPGQKRQHSGSLYSCDLDYDIYKDDLPYRVCEYQKIPPLITRIPDKTRRGHLGNGAKTGLATHTGSRGSGSTAGHTKLRAEELHSIKGELSQIKVQVDNLLESLDRMDQRREHSAGSRESSKKSRGSGEASCHAGTLAQRKTGTEYEGPAPQQDDDSAEESTDTEEAARNHMLDAEGSN
ncbi:heterogeneous nuclear ribonucleoproteins C1/C2-like [Anolis sagrei]|uniref:heterogeneous nuclear ribonucleoproteins C1/C2-like n=1 Tax=Anolis sagrei TaxID=38937 RepID=UPI003521B0D5